MNTIHRHEGWNEPCSHVQLRLNGSQLESTSPSNCKRMHCPGPLSPHTVILIVQVELLRNLLSYERSGRLAIVPSFWPSGVLRTKMYKYRVLLSSLHRELTQLIPVSITHLVLSISHHGRRAYVLSHELFPMLYLTSTDYYS